MGVPFLKMHGLGNDFVVLDGRQRPLALDRAQRRAIADRKTGVGCDQLIVIEPTDDPQADAAAVPLETLGPQLEHHPMFPERANIEVAEVRTPHRIRLRVWERSAGITRACGSGACATIVAANLRGLTGRRAVVELDGGELTMEWLRNGHVLMTGPVATSFVGELPALAQ